MALRGTQQVTEAAAGGAGKLRGTRQIVEILTSQKEPINKSISQSLIFSQSASADTIQKTVAQSLEFSQSTAIAFKLSVAPSAQALQFGHSAGSDRVSKEVSQTLQFSQYASDGIPIEESLTQSLVFSQTATPGLYASTTTQSLVFTQNAAAGKIIPGGIERSTSSNLVFSQTATEVKILATATAAVGTSGLVFSQYAGFPTEVQIPHAIIFSHVLNVEVDRLVEHTVVFTQDQIEYNHDAVRSASNGLVFTHSFVYIDDVSLCTYDPKVGANNDPNAPTPPSATAPTLTRQSTVTLFYPTVSPTVTVEIRAPNLGDRDRLSQMRIQRESRGGTLQIFADPTWPKLQILALQFMGLTEGEALEVQSFFISTLGQTVGFTDWEGRTWHGIIVTPDEPFIRNGRTCRVDISFEFEGELQ
jgi:hypothetical protein